MAGLALPVSNNLPNSPVARVRVFAEHAEHELHQEVGGAERLDAFCRMPSASLAKRSAASTVIASLVMRALASRDQ